MLTIETIIQVIKKHNGEITNVHVVPPGFVCCKLSNGANPLQPYRLIIPMNGERPSPSIYLASVATVRPDSVIPAALAMANSSCTAGYATVDCRGKVSFRNNCARHGGQGQDLTAEQFEQTFNETIASFREVEKCILFGNMLDSGIHINCADIIMGALFAEWKATRPDHRPA